MTALPAELTDAVLDYLPWDLALLRACSLVTQRFRKRTLPCLFRGLSVYYYQPRPAQANDSPCREDVFRADVYYIAISVRRIKALHMDKTASHLLCHVRELRIQQSGGTVDWVSIMRLLGRHVLPQVERLVLDVKVKPEELQHLLQPLPGEMPVLHSLCIGQEQKTNWIPFTIFSRFKKLQTLSLAGRTTRGLEPNTAPTFGQPIRFTLSANVASTTLLWLGKAENSVDQIRGIFLGFHENDLQNNHVEFFFTMEQDVPEIWKLIDGAQFVCHFIYDAEEAATEVTACQAINLLPGLKFMQLTYHALTGLKSEDLSLDSEKTAYSFEGDLPAGLSLMFENDFERQLLPIKVLVVEVEIVSDRLELLETTYSWRKLDDALQHTRWRNLQKVIMSFAVADVTKERSLAARVEAAIRTGMVTCNTSGRLDVYVTEGEQDQVFPLFADFGRMQLLDSL